MIINNTNINYSNNNNYIIAEICYNHCGDINLAKEFILKAKESGADAVKFQKRNNKKLFTKKFFDSEYNSKNSFAETYGLHREKIEFNILQIKELFDYTKSIELDFIITPFDQYSLYEIENNINVDAYKISSYDFVNLPLIEKILELNKPVIFSTGAQDMETVLFIYNNFIKKSNNNNICIMQCTSSYPCNSNLANINVIQNYRNNMPDIIIGFSCHNDNIFPSIGAYSKGALIIEKHFTIDRKLKGSDNVFSLTPDMLKQLKNTLNQIQPCFGNYNKFKMEQENKPYWKLSKQIVASRNLKANHIITKDDIDIKSPGDGLSPIHYYKFIGKKLKKNINIDESLTFQHI